MKTTLGNRMKAYERVSEQVLVGRMPMIIRLDGKAFHAWTKRSGCMRPFDRQLMDLMAETMRYLCVQIDGALFGYTQSDEISILVRDDQSVDTIAWMGKRLQKVTSVSASLATYYFNANSPFESRVPAFFDARAFVLPENEVRNYFIWRQTDASTNSLSMLAQSLYTHKELQYKNQAQLQELCWQKGCNWNHLQTVEKRGSCVYWMEQQIVRPKGIANRRRLIIDREIPVFSSEKADAWWQQVLRDGSVL